MLGEGDEIIEMRNIEILRQINHLEQGQGLIGITTKELKNKT